MVASSSPVPTAFLTFPWITPQNKPPALKYLFQGLLLVEPALELGSLLTPAVLCFELGGQNSPLNGEVCVLVVWAQPGFRPPSPRPQSPTAASDVLSARPPPWFCFPSLLHLVSLPFVSLNPPSFLQTYLPPAAHQGGPWSLWIERPTSSLFHCSDLDYDVY